MSKKKAKNQGKKWWRWVALVLVMGLIVVAVVGLPRLGEHLEHYDDVNMELMKKKLSQIDNVADTEQIFMGRRENGWIADHIEGGGKTVIYGYFNYADEKTAVVMARMERLAEEQGLAVVWRNYFSWDSDNAVRMAVAAEAAGKQGHWWDFVKLATERRSDWWDKDNVWDIAVDYFREVSDGDGDEQEFREETLKRDVLMKVAFDSRCSMKRVWNEEPLFVLDGQEYNIDALEIKLTK